VGPKFAIKKVFMGLSIVLTRGKPFFPSISFFEGVAAYKTAKIHEVFFDKWIDIKQFCSLNPTRVSIVDNMVFFKGPVLILSSRLNIYSIKFGIPLLLGIASGILARVVIRAIQERRFPPDLIPGSGRKSIELEKTRFRIGIGIGLTVAVLSMVLLHRIIPKDPGIYFFTKNLTRI
jgi:hypothetical protein